MCVRQTKNGKVKTRNPAAPKTHHEVHSSTATATTSRRCATNHVPRVSPYSPASIDPGFVETGLVQLSQSVTTTNGTHRHTQTDRQTDKTRNCTPYAPRYEETFWPIGKKRRRPLRSLGLASFKQKQKSALHPTSKNPSAPTRLIPKNRSPHATAVHRRLRCESVQQAFSTVTQTTVSPPRIVGSNYCRCITPLLSLLLFPLEVMTTIQSVAAGHAPRTLE